MRCGAALEGTLLLHDEYLVGGNPRRPHESVAGLGDAGRLAPCGGVQAVSGFEVSDGGSAGLVLALALWLLILAPQWVLLLWGVKHLARVREAVARRFGWKLLAFSSWMGAIGLAIIGTVWVCRDLLGPERLAVQRFVANATLAQEGLLVIVGILLASRRRAGRDAPGSKVRKQPSRRYLSRLLVGWVVTAVVLVGLALGPFAGRPAQAQIWRALAFAVAGIGITIVLLRNAAKRTGLKDDDDSTRSS